MNYHLAPSLVPRPGDTFELNRGGPNRDPRHCWVRRTQFSWMTWRKKMLGSDEIHVNCHNCFGHKKQEDDMNRCWKKDKLERLE